MLVCVFCLFMNLQLKDCLWVWHMCRRICRFAHALVIVIGAFTVNVHAF